MRKASYLLELRKQLLAALAKDHGIKPTQKGAQKFVMELLSTNFDLAEFYTYILFAQVHSFQTTLDELGDIVGVEQFLTSIQGIALLHEPTLVEIYKTDKSLVPDFALMFQNVQTQDHKAGYLVNLFVPGKFPATISRFYVLPSNLQEPVLQCVGKRLVPVKQRGIGKDSLFYLTMRALSEIVPLDIQTKTLSSTALKKLKIPDWARAKKLDKRVIGRIKDLHGNKVKSYEAKVPLSLITPFDPFHCLEYPSSAILTSVLLIKKHHTPRLLLYWSKNTFVMSDDYGPYLAYRLLDIDPVPSTIIGLHPEGLVETEKVGGFELLPNLLVKSSRPLQQIIPVADVGFHISARLAEIRTFSQRLSLVPRLQETARSFGKLLARPNLRETDVARFLADHPELIDPTALLILWEVRLGTSYRIDAVLQHVVGSVSQTTLIELENPNHTLFTRSGRQTAPVTHAIQQVEDWIRWWRKYPERIPKPIVAEYPPHGMVVVGRSKTLTLEEEGRLEHLNADRVVKVVTYDALLDRYRRLLDTIVAVSREDAL